jgi:tetratricopeptide (TPR) repeat protein
MAHGPGRYWSNAWLALAACAAARAGAAETGAPAPAGDWTALTEPLLSRIEEEEARSGPLSPNLVEPLTSLGLTYQESGEHVLAVAVLDRALYLKRVNEGLFGLDQAPLVRRLVDSERAIGRAATAEELEGKLLELARRNPGDLRGVPIFRAAAEAQLARYERYLRGERSPVLAFGGNAVGGPSGSGAFVAQAQMYYQMGIRTILRSGELDHPDLDALEVGLARAYYAQASTLSNWSAQSVLLSPDYVEGFSPTTQRQSIHDRGREHYRRRLNRHAAELAPIDRARALVELGDWSLLFSHNGTAVKRYAEAHTLLVEQRVPEASIIGFFPTDVPVFLPTFSPHPLGVATSVGAGHVDVDFEIGRYGQSRKVRIVAVAGEDAVAKAKEVLDVISRGRFRPSPLVDAWGGTEYRLRYSLADGSLTPRL